MKISVIITTILIAQVSASFYDVFQGAMISVQNGFGKLFSDVVSDVKDTVDCTILAVEHVLSLSADATARYYEKCGNGMNNTASTTPTKEENVPKIQIAISTNDENLKKEIPEEINATLAKLLEGYHLNDRLEDVGVGLTKETQRLVDISELVKQELDKLASEINIDFKNLGRSESKPTVDSILEQLKLLAAIERNLRNTSEAQEVHKVIDNVLRKLDAIEATEAAENDKVERIMKDLESNSSNSYADLRRQLKELQDKERLHVKLIKNKIEEHHNSPKNSEIINMENTNQTKIKRFTKYNETYTNEAVREKRHFKEMLLQETNTYLVNATKPSATEKTITTTISPTKTPSNSNTLWSSNVTSSLEKYPAFTSGVNPNITTLARTIIVYKQALHNDTVHKSIDNHSTTQYTTVGKTVDRKTTEGLSKMITESPPPSITESPFATIITDGPFLTTTPSLFSSLSTNNDEISPTPTNNYKDVLSTTTRDGEFIKSSTVADEELKLTLTTEVTSTLESPDPYSGSKLNMKFEATTILIDNVNLSNPWISTTTDESLFEESTTPLPSIPTITQTSKGTLNEDMTTTLNTSFTTTETTSLSHATLSEISTLKMLQPSISDMIETSTMSSITKVDLDPINTNTKQEDVTTLTPTVPLPNLASFLNYMDQMLASTPSPFKVATNATDTRKALNRTPTPRQTKATDVTKYPRLATNRDRKQLPDRRTPYRRTSTRSDRIPPSRLRSIPPRYGRKNRRIPLRSTFASTKSTPPPRRYTNPTSTGSGSINLSTNNDKLPFVRSPIKNLSDFFNPPTKKDNKINKTKNDSENTSLNDTEARRRAVRDARNIIADSQRANRVINSILNGNKKGQSVFGISNSLNSEN